MKKMDIAEQIAWLMRGVDDVISPALLEEKLKSGRRLKIKQALTPHQLIFIWAYGVIE